MAQMDYSFKGTVIWEPPAYPFKGVQQYSARLLVEKPEQQTGFKLIKNVATVSFWNPWLHNLNHLTRTSRLSKNTAIGPNKTSLFIYPLLLDIFLFFVLCASKISDKRYTQ